MVLYLIESNKLEKKEKNKKKIKEFTFYFYEKHIKIKCKRQFERLKYFRLHKVFETDEYFFLYTDERSSLILNKAGFEVGTPKEFSKQVFVKETRVLYANTRWVFRIFIVFTVAFVVYSLIAKPGGESTPFAYVGESLNSLFFKFYIKYKKSSRKSGRKYVICFFLLDTYY